MLGQAVSYLPQKIEQVGEYVAERGGELGFPKTGAVAGMAVANEPYFMVPGGGASKSARGALDTLARKAEQSASSSWFKGVGGTLHQAKELGAEEALRVGRMARDRGIITPLNSVETQSANITAGLAESGKRLEELRGLGDLYGDSPEAMKIVQAIKQDLGPKYATGIRSGEMGDLERVVQEVMKLEPLYRLTPGEEVAGFLKRDIPTGSGSFQATTPAKGFPLKAEKNPSYPLAGDEYNLVGDRNYVPPTSKTIPTETNPYERFRLAQEDPNYVPEYDLRRSTTYDSVSKVATDINAYAKDKSSLLRPIGADTAAADVISRVNNESLMKALPKEKGAEYQSNLGKYSDLSILDRMNDLKFAAEVGGSRNRIVNNLANRIYQKFGHQLSAAALDKIAGLLRSRIPTGVKTLSRKAVISQLIDRITTKQGGNQ
jgi:hypothetical protein